MEQQQWNDDLQDKELSLKDLILKIKSFYIELLKSWKVLALLVVVFVSIFTYLAFTSAGIYPANLTFIINRDEGKKMAGVSSILFQFGLGGGGGEYNMDRIVGLSKSMRIIRAGLFEKATIDGAEDYFANHIIRVEGLHHTWKDNTNGLNDFLFTHHDFDSFSRLENNALKKIFNKIIGKDDNGLLEVGYGEFTKIFSISFESQSEQLSIDFTNALYRNLSQFYIQESIEKPHKTYTNLKQKTDSLQAELNVAEYSLAKFVESHRGLISQTEIIKQNRYERKIGILSLAFGKAIENLEIAEFSLKNATPFFQVIDAPMAPIKQKKKSLIVAIFFGGVLGAFLGALFIVGRKIIKDALSDSNSST
ncbi:MAG: hypothetical protein AAGG75_18045, partial [Bacteroidota bacterium]